MGLPEACLPGFQVQRNNLTHIRASRKAGHSKGSTVLQFNQRETQVRTNRTIKAPCKTDPPLSLPPHFARAHYHQLHPPKPPGVSQCEGYGHTRLDNSEPSVSIPSSEVTKTKLASDHTVQCAKVQSPTKEILFIDLLTYRKHAIGFVLNERTCAASEESACRFGKLS